jgi:hypothetical protein
MKWKILQLTLIIITSVSFLFVSPFAVGSARESEIPSNLPEANPQLVSPNTTYPQNSGLIRIFFAPGTTSAVVGGGLSANTTVRYVLRALYGQLMDVNLSAPEGVSLFITTSWGWPLLPITGSSTSFRGYLPATGDYIITVTSSSDPVSYSFNVMIPQRISFELGATSASLEGHLNPYQGHDYILRAQAGQLMEINITPDNPDNNLQLIIYGVDGSVLRSGMGDGSTFRGELPFSEDYIVTVRAGDRAVSFNMNVIIPQRISFQPGAISGAVTGKLSAYHSQYYVLRAMKNQTMQVEVLPGNNVKLIIYGADGTVLKSGMGEGASFTGVLPSSQDYILVVNAGNYQVTYTLLVTIQ